ncbi:amidohydrolase [Crystallibacter degradans]|uniref:amidohydrolase n=1 Tax=Crystallibacter degradans TaxID=2726743 RepID=UPI001472C419|nr:amidohydrolase [Arthrobacter sp. SF27]NMR29119.1 amidohydrolase [Arthrobacter sp. SF27]
MTTHPDLPTETVGSTEPTADPQLRLDYEWLHRYPELSTQEHHTAAFVEDRLRQAGLEPFRCGGTGVVAVLQNGQGPVAAFRADIDALPVQEDTGLPYSSQATATNEAGETVPVMHACGHDAHTAMALAAARSLATRRDTWSGTAVFIFQPGEETAQGATAMVDDRLWDRAPRPDVLFAQHVTASEAGTIQLSPGSAFSMADAWSVQVHGVQGHAAHPHQSVDAVVLAAHMVVRMQSIVSREVPPLESAIISVGTIHAGLKENIIAGRAEFTVNVRTFDPTVRERVLASLRRVISGEAHISGASEPEITELYRFPESINDQYHATDTARHLGDALGHDRITITGPATASEDVGHLTAPLQIPLVYWRLGSIAAARINQGPVPGNHSPQFAPDPEPTLAMGHRAAVAALLSVLQY